MPTPPRNVHFSKFTCDLRDGAVLHFIPHEKNDYVPHVLKHHVLAGYSAIGILLKAFLILAPTFLPAAVVFSSAVTSANIVKLTNVARVGAELPELHSDSRLATAAAGKANDIIEKQYFSHVSPEGKTPWDWIHAAGYEYRHAGENLAMHYFTSEGVQEGWMASPAHKQNILDTRFTDIGVGVQQGKYEGFDTVVVVQMFGVLKTAPVAVAATKPTEVTPTPKPTPAAVAAKPAPVIAEASVKIVPSVKGYDIAADVRDAESVKAYLGPDSVTLEKNETGTWKGSLDTTVAPADPQYLFVGATAANGEKTYEPVATIVPSEQAADLYANGMSKSRRVGLFGVTVTGLEDGIRRFYFLAIGLLALALALKVFIKLRVQRHAVIAHSLFVIALFAVLAVR